MNLSKEEIADIELIVNKFDQAAAGVEQFYNHSYAGAFGRREITRTEASEVIEAMKH